MWVRFEGGNGLISGGKSNIGSAWQTLAVGQDITKTRCTQGTISWLISKNERG